MLFHLREEKEGKVRTELQQRVNDNFAKMYHGERSISIDDKYRVRYADVTTEESDGLKAVKSFAFIASLVSMAMEVVEGDKKGKMKDICIYSDCVIADGEPDKKKTEDLEYENLISYRELKVNGYCVGKNFSGYGLGNVNFNGCLTGFFAVKKAVLINGAVFIK